MENNIITSAFRKKVGSTQNTAEATIKATEDENISKVLGVKAKACVSNMEILNGEANYTLSILFDVTYCDENKNICCAKENVSVSGKYENNLFSNLMDPIYKVEVVDASILGASNNDVKVQAVVELSINVIDYNNLEPFKSSNENVLVKNEPSKVLVKLSGGNALANIADEFELKQNVSKIICKDVNVCIKNITSNTGYFTIEGDMHIKAYLCIQNGEDKSYKPFCETISFKEEVDAENVVKESNIEANFCTKYDEITFDIENNETTSILKVNVPISVRYVALASQNVDLPCDAYSTTHKVNLITDSYLLSEQTKNVVKEHIEGAIEIDPNLPRIAKILLVTPNSLNITNNSAQNGMVNIEGILTVTVTYLGDDDEESLNSVQVEVPFASSVDLENIRDIDTLFIKANLMDIFAKAKKGKDIEIEAEVLFDSVNYSTTAQTFVKEVVLTEELNKNPYPLSIYLAPEGSTLWDISKQLSVKENIILSQNPNLVFPLENNQSIVYFNQK